MRGLEENNQTSNREEIASCGNEANEMGQKTGGLKSSNPLAIDEKFMFLSTNERSKNELAVTKEPSNEASEKEGEKAKNHIKG